MIRYGEIVLKGLNRPLFEDRLIKNIKRTLKGQRFKIWKSQARIYIEPLDGESLNTHEFIPKLRKVFGIVSLSPALKVNTDINEIYKAAEISIKENLNVKTFKVEAKRGDKSFPLTSPEICVEVGGHILDIRPELVVDVINPDTIVKVEVREFSYVYSEIIPACGGLPTGTSGKAMCLLSGGIDSPVAGWMIAKRGVQLDAVHFFSAPYTGPKAKEKVIDLCKIVASYVGGIRLHIVPFTDIQLAIRDKCPEEQLTIIMRRFMMRIAERVAEQRECSVLITGENLGQVASQTMKGLVASDSVVGMPVFRPLIGMDKNEIISLARKIGTFETSILPYEDCCTIFSPKHPETKPKIERLEMSERKLDMEELIEKAIAGIETVNC